VGTPAGGIPEVVLHEQTGLLVPDGDPVALAAALARLLTDEPLRRRLIAAGQERITAVFGRDQAIAPFLALYDEVAGHHPH
jgi:glycosyltransferase involved in cell wall biosynthesis